MLLKLLSYSLLFPNFKWFVLTAQPARAQDVSQSVILHQEICHLNRSHSTTLLSTFLRSMIPLRSWSWYLREKTLRKQRQKFNNCSRTMATTMTMTTRMTTTTTMTIMRKKKTTRLKKKMMRTTLF
jgi:hypothetical protein